jgi:hypothetical protein
MITEWPEIKNERNNDIIKSIVDNSDILNNA